MKQAVKMLKRKKYKLRMFGIEMMKNETKTFGDNNALILNLSVLESTVKKNIIKSN